MTWYLGEMAPFDTESTGTDVENDRIVSATVARIRPGQPVDVHSHLISVDVAIPQAATDVHGITTEHAQANGQPAAVVLDLVAGALADAMLADVAVVGSNLAFDFTLLDRDCRRHGVPTVQQRLGRPLGPVVDVFVIDKALDRYRPGKRQLDALCRQYGVRLDGAHDAENDALGAARVAYRIGQRAQQALVAPQDVMDTYSDRRYPDRIVRGFQEFGKLTLAEVHAGQVGWYAEQAEGLAQYWRRQANELEYQSSRASDDAERATALADAEDLRRRADGVTTDWPIRPYGERVQP